MGVPPAGTRQGVSVTEVRPATAQRERLWQHGQTSRIALEQACRESGGQRRMRASPTGSMRDAGLCPPLEEGATMGVKGAIATGPGGQRAMCPLKHWGRGPGDARGHGRDLRRGVYGGGRQRAASKGTTATRTEIQGDVWAEVTVVVAPSPLGRQGTASDTQVMTKQDPHPSRSERWKTHQGSWSRTNRLNGEADGYVDMTV